MALIYSDGTVTGYTGTAWEVSKAADLEGE